MKWLFLFCVGFFFFKQKTAYEMRISDWSSDVCSSDLIAPVSLEFEDQCFLLFQAHWGDPNAQKNGRNGQTQHGTDIYGQPKSEIGRASCRERVCQYV